MDISIVLVGGEYTGHTHTNQFQKYYITDSINITLSFIILWVQRSQIKETFGLVDPLCRGLGISIISRRVYSVPAPWLSGILMDMYYIRKYANIHKYI